MKTGIFTHEFAKQLEVEWNGGVYGDLQEVKLKLIGLINSSTANRANKMRISSYVSSAKDFMQVLFIIYNHILAHTSENLKVVR